MSVWDTYPADYRAREVDAIKSAVQAGECAAVVGLSGAGKSNLLGFIVYRVSGDEALPRFVLVDCNRLSEHNPQALFRLVRQALGESNAASDELAALDVILQDRLNRHPTGLCLLLDRFDALSQSADPSISGNLRALRDTYKYQLTYVTATRHPLDPNSELAELFYAHVLWLGPLSESDAHWNIARYAWRKRLTWGAAVTQKIYQVSWGYPSLLRAVCEAHADGVDLEVKSLLDHPAVQRRVSEFWTDDPSEEALRLSSLEGQPLLMGGQPRKTSNVPVDTTQLTAKEHLLLEYFRHHPDQVCEKDDLIHAVWFEDKIFERGIRDDSLAQLVRRLREKIELDPSSPHHIHTVPGRGYRYSP